MDSRSSRRAGFTTFPVFVAVLAIGVALAFPGTADAQTTTKSIGVSGGTTPTAPTVTTPATQTTNGGATNDGMMNDFEQLLLSELQKALTSRFPDASQDDVTFLADLLLGFFMEQMFYNQLQQMNWSNTQR